MAEEYKVQISIKNDLGHLLNVRGEDFTEVHGKLTGAYGEEVATAILESFSTRQAVQTVTAAFGSGQVQEVPAQGSPAQGVQPSGTAQGAVATQPSPQSFAQPPAQGAPVAQQGVVPTCGLCGMQKEQRNGQYGTFWSCPNWSNDAHKAAKAAGQKF